MSFRPNAAYGAYNNKYDNIEWQSVWKNSNKTTGGDSVIDFVQAQLEVSSELETTDFSKSKNDLNKLAGIVVTQDRFRSRFPNISTFLLDQYHVIVRDTEAKDAGMIIMSTT